MEFTFSSEADEAADLAAQILKAHCTPEKLRAVEAAEGDRFDAGLWTALADAGLLGLALPEEHGGSGLGLLEQARVVVEAGKLVAPVPLATHLAAARLLAESASDEQARAWLPGAADGSRLLTVAVAESYAAWPEATDTAADQADAGWVLTGTKVLVRAANRADAFLVTAATASGLGGFLVPAGQRGVTIEQQHTSDGDVTGLVRLDQVELPAEALVGDPAEGSGNRLLELLSVLACAEQLGLTEGALSLTAAYARTRQQFGTPIGTFQGVRHRLADGHMDVLAQGLTHWQAAWRVSEGMSAKREVAIARLWAADAGHRLAHTAVHVHGGVGIDLDGEAHRYFTALKRGEFTLGSATDHARSIGALLAHA